MDYRTLGNTGLEVSTFALGTVSLGVPYGIQVPGDSGIPSPTDAMRVLNRAADAGINLFDTAPSYGDSETIIGKAFSGRRDDLYVATKINLPVGKTQRARREAVFSSLENSLRNLRREVLDIVQIHNARAEDIRRGEITGFLREARRLGLVRFLGASVYGEQAALQATKCRHLNVLQVAFSILDQRPSQSIFKLASESQTGILVRSALLKGVLSKKASSLPDQLSPLRTAAERVRSRLNCRWRDLPEMALRFCISHEQISSVLIGARTCREFNQALSAWQSGPLCAECLVKTRALALRDTALADPSNWPIP